MADFDWGSLLNSGIGALGNYWAGNQYGNAADTAQKAADPFAPYRGAYANNLNGLSSQPLDQRNSSYTSGPFNGQLSNLLSTPYGDRLNSFTSGPFNTQLKNLQANPSSVSQLPGYQFGMDQGVNAIQRSAASKGLLDSGATGKALTRFGQDYASNQFNNERNFLSGQAANETGLANQFYQNQQNFIGNQANQERNFGAQQFENERNFLGKASGAFIDPYAAAMVGLMGRTNQLGAYGQGLGNLLGSAAGGGQGGLLGSLTQGGANSPASSAINGFINWAKGLGGNSGSAGSSAGAGYTNATDLGMYDNGVPGASGGASGGASAPDVQSYPYTNWWDTGAQGYALPDTAAGAGMSYGGDIGSDIPGGIDWSSFGSGTGEAAASTGTADAATGAAGAAGGASLASAIPYVGGVYALGALLNAWDDNQTAKDFSGGSRTFDRLTAAGVNPSEITASNLLSANKYWETDPTIQSYVNQLKTAPAGDRQGIYTNMAGGPMPSINQAFEAQHPGALAAAGINGMGADLSNLTRVMPDYQNWFSQQQNVYNQWINSLMSQYPIQQSYEDPYGNNSGNGG